MAKKNEQVKNKEGNIRPPIVVVMGHVDHGKTKILDYIRKTKVAEGESGGITQHIGAYEAEYNGKKITFIDTPGHEAFSAMRSRGARVADIAVLVVAADEGVKPQTKEAVSIIQGAKLPFLVALNKIDKPAADPNRVKKELAENGVLVEGWGGKTPAVEISAKEGKNMDEFLETILLLAELEDLKSGEENRADGVVIESHLDPRRGATATLLIQSGGFDLGDCLAIGGFAETPRILENFKGASIKSARASMPVVVSSLEHIPVVGDTFASFKTENEARDFAKTEASKQLSDAPAETAMIEAKPTLFVVLKSDMAGSQEALESIINALIYPEVAVKIIKSELGDIVESDIKTAQTSKNTIVAGFRVKIEPVIKQLAESHGVKIALKDIIYEILDAVKSEMSELIPPEIKRNDLGNAKILAVFKSAGKRQIVGGKVMEGKISDFAAADIVREGNILGAGKILELQHRKKKVTEITAGLEFGIMMDSGVKIQKDDILKFFEEEVIRKKL